MALEPVGNYAVRIKFDDLHDTGIFSWRYLYELGRDQDEALGGISEALAEERASAASPSSRGR